MESERSRQNIVLCGLGGQGILFMTRILSRAALAKGFAVLGAETHGMAQRGGSVVSHLRLGQVRSSLVREGTAGLLLALDQYEAYRNLPFVAPGANLYINMPVGVDLQPAAAAYLESLRADCCLVPALELAMELGSARSANLALLGHFASRAEKPFGAREMRATVAAVSPERFRETNLAVFDAGLNWSSSGGC